MSTVRLVTANMDKERAGDDAYDRYLTKLAGRPSLILRQEVGHGLKSTRIRGRGVTVRDRARLILGKVGVHRGIARAAVTINGTQVAVLSVHGLHLRTSGKTAQDAYYARLVRHVHRLDEKGRPWIAGGDFNRPIRDVARMLGGHARGEGVDGFVVSRGLTVTNEFADATGRDCGWTDHDAYVVDITTKETP